MTSKILWGNITKFMNKKVKIILLSAVMTTPTIIPLLAASCSNEDPRKWDKTDQSFCNYIR
ncbi:variable surface lipoprotein [Metamycoplasma hyosynoviae]|uniref:variable surface lipoprotein n=1 Tax=Metamycoplasma hyosynoviae TaxID=29559 RepID=UPI003B639E4A